MWSNSKEVLVGESMLERELEFIELIGSIEV